MPNYTVAPLTPAHELFASINHFMPGGYAPAGTTAAAAAPAPAAGGKVKMTKAEKTAASQPKADKKGAKKGGKEEVALVPFVNKTPEGERKDLSEPMDAGYNPQAVEAAWYEWWIKKEFFTPDAEDAVGTTEDERFIMCLPPPNVTGSLHLGHTLTGAIQDSLVRWHRMCGHKTLYIPGTDHAGIATQSTVERRLLKEEGLTRHDLGREEFLKRVWQWKEKFGSRICSQLRLIASSLDWSRECFTMDAERAESVVEGFNQFFEQGLIFRDNKLVNWCPHLRTALSDLEVDHVDLTAKTLLTIPGTTIKAEVGVITSFKYKVKGTNDYLTVATTRLETMLGDVAVAVHPEDDRYKKYVGKELEHPFCKDRTMVVLADTMVDKEFGTGAVKITPAHDLNDFKVGKTHKLKFISVFGDDGHINGAGGAFKGQHRFEARRTIEEALTKLGLFVGKKDHAMRLGICSRSGDIIEPMQKPQWWMNCDNLAKRSADVVRNGELKIVPAFHEQTWYYWLDNIRDWCISRQLWWGHRIPAWKVVSPVQKDEDGELVEKWFVGRNEAAAYEKARKEFGKDVKLEQDEDVLDTWFSSGLFPMSPLKWPNEGHMDFKAFFPTSVLETGHDILFFWVARMVMMSLGLTGKLPFHTVYLHAMVRDAHGRKMSKSLGNVIEPNEVIDGITLPALWEKLEQGNLVAKEVEKAKKGQEEDFPKGIPQCGADALRFGLLAYTCQGRSINLDINRVVAYRHFCNKLWNCVKFALGNFPADFKPKGINPSDPLQWEDEWIMSRFAEMISKTNAGMKAFQLADATTATYNFWLYDFSNVYLEIVKRRMQEKVNEEGVSEGPSADKLIALEVLYMCLDRGLRALHPLLPFVTEELYQRLPKAPWMSESICIAAYPTDVPTWTRPIVEEEMELLQKTNDCFRSLASSVALHPKERPAAFVRHSDAEKAAVINKLAHHCCSMARLGSVTTIGAKADTPPGCVASVLNDQCTVYLQVADLVDLSKEVAKQEKKLAAAEKSLQSYYKKMEMPNYDTKVPEDVQKLNTEKSAALTQEIAEMKDVITALKKAAGM